MKLYLKIMVFILVLISVALWTNRYFSRIAVTEAMSAQITDSAVSAVSDLVPALQSVFADKNELKGLKTLHAFAQKTGALYAAAVLPDGTVVAHTNVALAGVKLSDALMVKALRVPEPAFQRGYYGGEDMVEVVIPIPGKAPVSGEDLLLAGMEAGIGNAGFVRAGLPLAPASKAESDINFKLMVLAALISLTALAFSALFTRVMLRQVSFLGEGIRKVRDGDYAFSVPVVTRDELGEVAASFNKLSRSLSETTVSKRYLDSVLESMPDPLIITDERGAVIKANRAAVEFSGYDFMPPGSMNLKDLLEPQAEGAAAPFSLLGSGVRIKELDLWFLAKGGRRLPVMLSAAFTGSAGRQQVVAVLKDMAEHKESEARLARYLKEVETVNSELDSFAHTVSHDLKEPLRGIEVFSGMLLSDYSSKLDPQGTDYLGRVVKASGRMRRLIDDLLSYARVSRVRNPYERASTAELAAEAAAGLSALIEERKAELRVSGTMPQIFCDSVKMRQVFQNLISNAVKYNDKPVPEIEVGAEKSGDYYWKFFVKDNGIGISSRYFDEIFRMFKRLHVGQDYGGGTGAGLAIVKKIVEEHNGKIWVESAEGKGSVFYILIPADPRKYS